MAGDTVNMPGTYQAPVYVKSNIYAGVPAAHAAAEALAAARVALAAMPTDRVPAPQVLPAGSRLPHAPNPAFLGRDDKLLELARALKGDDPEAAVFRPACACGLGGVGKTQLAAEFAHRFGRHFAGGVFWVDCASGSEGAIDAEVAACGLSGSPDLPADYAAQPQPEQLRLMAALWQSPTPRLLVLDNCEDEALLRRLRPPHGGCRVLVTSRKGEWPQALAVHPVPLGPLRRADSVALLRRLYDVPVPGALLPDTTAAGLDQLNAIAAELGDLALALHLAGSYLHEHRDAPWGEPARYLAALRGAQVLNHPSMRGEHNPGGAEDFLPTGHARHIGRTFAVSLERLRPDAEPDATARRTLGLAACFAPGVPIPRAILRKIIDPGEEEATLARAEAALKRLTALGLLTREPSGALTVHRLVAAFARAEDPDPTVAEQLVAQCVTDALEKANRTRLPAAGRPLVVHAEHLAGLQGAAGSELEDLLPDLLGEVGVNHFIAGSPLAARVPFERALAIQEKALGPDHPDVASSLNNLGAVLRALGDLAGARARHEHALAIQEKALGPDHPDLFYGLGHLGIVLRALGDLAGARARHERALAIQEKALGPDHPDVASSLSNFGAVLQDLGDLAGARARQERALAIREKALGPDHPDVASSLGHLGAVLQDLGDLAGARARHERALAIQEKALGPDHPDVASSLNNLGAVLRALGDLAGARARHERALAIREKALGPDHPDVASSLNNLGAVLRALGDLAGARARHEHALAIQEKALGPDHPDLFYGLGHLGIVLRALGDLAGARARHERALAIQEKALGPDHPDVASSLSNFGAVLQDLGDLAGARARHERALAIREKALGPDHPDVASSLGHLGAVLRALGDLAGARARHERALAIQEKALGPDHPDVASSLGHLGAVLQDLGDLAGARARHERALAIQEKALGPDHPDVASSLGHLGAVLQDLGDLAGARARQERALAIRRAQP